MWTIMHTFLQKTDDKTDIGKFRKLLFRFLQQRFCMLAKYALAIYNYNQGKKCCRQNVDEIIKEFADELKINISRNFKKKSIRYAAV